MSTNTYYTYDKSGRMTSQYVPGGEAHYYGYNQRNMLTSVQDVGGSSDALRTFVYNGLGERVVAFDSTANAGQPAYWSYDGRKLILDKQRTSLGGFNTTSYRHGSTLQDCSLGSLVEIGLSDNSAGYPVMDGAGNVTNIQNPTDGINDSFVANFFMEQIAATDNFKTRPRSLSGSGALRSQMSQEIYLLPGGPARITSKDVVLGGGAGIGIYPAKQFWARTGLLKLIWLLSHQGGSVMPCGGPLDESDDSSKTMGPELPPNFDPDPAGILMHPPLQHDPWSCKLEIVCRPTARNSLVAWAYSKLADVTLVHCFIVYSELEGDKRIKKVVYSGGPEKESVLSPGKLLVTSTEDPNRGVNANIAGIIKDDDAYYARAAGAYPDGGESCACSVRTKGKLESALLNMKNRNLDYGLRGPNSNSCAGFLWCEACGLPLKALGGREQGYERPAGLEKLCSIPDATLKPKPLVDSPYAPGGDPNLNGGDPRW